MHLLLPEGGGGASAKQVICSVALIASATLSGPVFSKAPSEGIPTNLTLSGTSNTIYRDKATGNITVNLSGTGSFQQLSASEKNEYETAGIETLKNLTINGSTASVTLNGGTHIFAGQWGQNMAPTESNLSITGGSYTLNGNNGFYNANGSAFTDAVRLGIDGTDRIGHGNYGGRSLIGATGTVTVANATITSVAGSGDSYLMSAYGSIQLNNVKLDLNKTSVWAMGRDNIGTETNSNVNHSSKDTVGNIKITNTGNQSISLTNSSINAWRSLEISAPNVTATGTSYLWGQTGTTEITATSGEGQISLSQGAHIGATSNSSHSTKSSSVTLSANKIDIQSGAGVDGGTISATTPTLVVQGENSHIFSSEGTTLNNLQIVTVGGTGSGQNGGQIGNGSGSVTMNFAAAGTGEGLSLSNGASINGTQVKVTTNNRDVTIDSNSFINASSTGATVDAGSADVTLSNGGSITSANGSTNTITGGSVSLSDGSHIGTDAETDVGGNVTINSSELSLSGESYITSANNVNIKNDNGDTSVKLDESGVGEGKEDSWIKGDSVTIGSSGSSAGKTTVVGGKIESTGTSSSDRDTITIVGGSQGVVIDDVHVNAGQTGSIKIDAAQGGKIEIGTNGADDTETNKDTQILGNDVTIGSGSDNEIDITDAQIGFPVLEDSTTTSGGSININGGSAEVTISGSEIGVVNDGKGHGVATGGSSSVTIGGGTINIGDKEKPGEGEGVGTGDKFDTAIGGDQITIGGQNAGSVTVGDAEIGTTTGNNGTGSNVDIIANGTDENPGQIVIGDNDGDTVNDFNSSINGGNINIGGGKDAEGDPVGNANVTIAGNHLSDKDGNPTNDSSTNIAGTNVTIGNGSGNVAISGSNVSSNGTPDDGTGDITIEVGSNDDLKLDDVLIDSTGGLASGGESFGQGSGTGNVTIIGGGKENASDIGGSHIISGGNVNFDGSHNIDDTIISAGDGQGNATGSVNFGNVNEKPATGTKGDNLINITGGTSVSGDEFNVGHDSTVNVGANGDGTEANPGDEGNSIFINNGGSVSVDGGLNIAGGNKIEGIGGLEVNTGTSGDGSISVSEGASISSGVGASDIEEGGDLTVTGSGEINVEGGSLVANGGQNGGGNILVNGGDVNLSNGGTIEAETGTVTVGDTASGGASINVDSGETGAIIAGGEGNNGNIIVTGNGEINVGSGEMDDDGALIPGSEGSLVVTTDKDKVNEINREENPGLVIDSDITVSVDDGGYVSSDDISFVAPGEGETTGKLDVGADGGIYTDKGTILDNVSKGEDGQQNGNIVIANGAEIQVGGTVTGDELSQIRDVIGTDSSLVVDHVDGIDPGQDITKDDMKDQWSGAVIGDAVIDVSNNTADSDAGDDGWKGGNNEISFGGGGTIMVDKVDGGTDQDSDGELHIKNPSDGEPNTGVVITGDENDKNHQIVIGVDSDGNKDTDGRYDIVLDGGADLTLGKDGSAGGMLNGSITAEGTNSSDAADSPDLNVVGGDFTVNGEIDLSYGDSGERGDINIKDNNSTRPDVNNGLTVTGDATADNLNMNKGDTHLDVQGDLDLTGNANLSGNAQVNVAGNAEIDGVLDLSGNASFGKDQQPSGAADSENSGDLSVGNLDISDGAELDRDNIYVVADENGNGGDAFINGNGSLTADGNFDADGAINIGTGTDLNGNTTEAGNPQVDVTGDMSSGGDMVIGQGVVDVDKDPEGNGSDGNITVGPTDGAAANLVVGNEDGSENANVTAEGNLNVNNGNATIYDNGKVDIDGNLTVAGNQENQTGDLTVEGELSVGGVSDIDGTLTVGVQPEEGKPVSDPNGHFVSGGKTEVGGNLVVNENGQVQVGFNPTDDADDDGSLNVAGSTTLGDGAEVTLGGDFNGNGDVTVDDDATISAAGGDINIKLPEGATGTQPNLIVNGGHVVSTEKGEGDPATGGNIKVGGNINIKENGTVNADRDISTGGTVNVESGSITAGGNLAIGGSTTEGASGLQVGFVDEENKTATSGSVNVDGELEVNDGGVNIANGSVTTGTGDLTGNLVVGSGSEDPKTTGQYVSDGKTNVSGDLLVNSDGTLSVGMNPSDASEKGAGNLTVGGSATIAGNAQVGGDLIVEGTSGEHGLVVGDGKFAVNEDGESVADTVVSVGGLNITEDTVIKGDATLIANGNASFSGGLTVEAGGSFENVSDDPETTTTVDTSLTLNAGSTVDVGEGKFQLDTGATVGNTDGDAVGSDSHLHGTISAGSIDLGNLAGNTITFSGGVTGEGENAQRFEAGFVANEFKGNAALANGATAVITGSTDAEGNDMAPKLEGFVHVQSGKDGALGSTFSTNASYEREYTEEGTAESDLKAQVYVDTAMNFVTTAGDETIAGPSGLVIGDYNDSTPTDSGIYFGANASLVVDASSMASGTTVFRKNDEAGSPMDIYLDSALTGGVDSKVDVSLSGWNFGTSGSLVLGDFGIATEEAVNNAFNFVSGNVLTSFGLKLDSDGIASVTMSVDMKKAQNLNGDLVAAVEAGLSSGGTNVSAAINEVFTSANGYVDANGTVSSTGNKVTREILTLPAAAGALNGTIEYLDLFTGVGDRHASMRSVNGLGNTAWVDVISSFNKSDTLFDGSGYKADLYGGVMGLDIPVGSADTFIGGAITVGNGDIKSRGAVINTTTDATFYGASIYGQTTIGALAVKGDFTYLRTENDISAAFEGVNLGGDLNTNAYSVGVRAEFAAYSSDKFTVKPHMGLRYTNYSYGSFGSTDIDDVNTLESPIGVAFSGNVQANGGWTVVPELDLTVVPQLMDREATVVNHGVGVDQTILEGAIFNAKLGLGLQKDNFSFGASYMHGTGGEGRNDNAFQAYARWTF